MQKIQLGLHATEYSDYKIYDDLINGNIIEIDDTNERNISVLNTDIEKLNLSSNNLEGKLNNNLSCFTNLTILNLSDNNIEGAIPESIGNLANAIYIDLSNNRFSGAIPISFNNLISLKLLVLYSNNLTELPPNMGSLTNLIDLNVNRNDIENIDSVQDLKNLRFLNIGHNCLKSLENSSLDSLCNLEELHLEHNKLTEIPSSIQNIKTLKVLNMSYNNIKSIKCNGRNPFESLEQLKVLNLSYNMLYGPVPLSIFSINSLKYLVLSNNQFSGTLPTIYPISMKSLIMSNNLFDGHIPLEILNCERLETLNLSFNNLTGAPIYELSLLQRIESLYVYNYLNITQVYINVFFLKKKKSKSQ